MNERPTISQELMEAASRASFPLTTQQTLEVKIRIADTNIRTWEERLSHLRPHKSTLVTPAIKFTGTLLAFEKRNRRKLLRQLDALTDVE